MFGRVVWDGIFVVFVVFWNMCGWKSVKMCVSVFEMWKLLFELGDQTGLHFGSSFKKKVK